MRRTSGGAWVRLCAVVFGCATLANCASSNKFTSNVDPRYGVAASPRVVAPGEPVPKGGGAYRVGKPYMVGGRMYVPQEDRNYRAEGLASWYGSDFHGRLTANGEVFDMESISAAHPTLPMPSYVRVTNLSNRKSLIVRVNDRGPYHRNREIDVSLKAAQLLGFHGNGVANVRVEYVGPAPLEGSDDRRLVATLREGTPAPAPSAIMVASARPFLPRGADAPMPPERPFELGLSGPEGREASLKSRPSQIAADPLPGVAYAEARPQRRAAAASSPMATAATAAPALGYVPPGWSVGPQAVMSGRGLY
jgi:peptidoglycan lytic transglycosylase